MSADELNFIVPGNVIFHFCLSSLIILIESVWGGQNTVNICDNEQFTAYFGFAKSMDHRSDCEIKYIG